MRGKKVAGSHLRQYLLGTAAPAAQEEVERRMLSDQAFLEELEIAEDELIDEYLSGGLPADERLPFEQYFLAAPERQQKFGVTSALKRRIAAQGGAAGWKPPSAHPSPTPARGATAAGRGPARRYQAAAYALAACLVVTVLGGAWLAVSRGQMRAELRELRAARVTPAHSPPGASQPPAAGREGGPAGELGLARRQRDALAAEILRLAEPARPGAPPAVFSAWLHAGQLRDTAPGAVNRLVVPAAVAAVRLSLDAEGDADYLYQAALTSNGQEVWRWENGRARNGGSGRAVSLALPAALLPPGSYQLTLHGRSAAGEVQATRRYYFSVAPR